MKHIIFIGLMLISALSYAQSNKPVTIKITVGGTCDMCKARIEKTVDVKGVKYAEYVLANHELEITYVPSKISEIEIHKLLNSVGHDTNKSKATDEQYDKIHHCCKYRTHVHEEGEKHDSETDKEEDHDHDHKH